MTGLRRSFAFSFVERYATSLINLGMTAALARLVSPDEIGVFVIGGTIILLGEILRDFGASSYLIQAQGITTEGVRTTFTVTFALSAFIVGLVLGTAEPIAAFYGDARLAIVLRIATAGFMLGAFINPILSLLRREMAFDRIALINIIGGCTNGATAIGLAMAGFGYRSLALAYVASTIAVLGVALAFRPAMTTFWPGFADWRNVFAFGGYASATAVINNLYLAWPQLVLARILGFDAVGIFSRATMLVQMPERSLLSALQPVLLPAFAREVRAGGDLSGAYLHGISLATAVQWPFLTSLAILAEPVVAIVLGPAWMEAAPIVRLLALGSMSLFGAFLTYPVLVALGRIKDTLTASLIVLPPSALIVTVAAFHSLEAVAASLFVTAPLQMIVSFIVIRRHMPFSWGALVERLARSAFVTAGASAAPLALSIVGGFTPHPGALALAGAVAGSAIGWLAALSATRHPLLELLSAPKSILNLVRTRLERLPIRLNQLTD
ncbi:MULTISPECIES: lipopolysaccharide biosynthesis protein [unclassified Chelatococcus]|uniref:lipopolysaccharide biosynthesis protein n=1 Tax=unclassified Chelatococcus TaxID=2638111 RepID=UPI001BCCFA70|nr:MULTISPECIES: lipopolysaccharide biosynthesis protein [unclassified Chelatococcus]MBS7695935.1 lipopolysaccharide biosynthesis protein [Chelatococcus sp. YT9]MBX3555690.1 lipopolysaccharide biosynthesis protein [Chelatococcus sp.]